MTTSIRDDVRQGRGSAVRFTLSLSATAWFAVGHRRLRDWFGSLDDGLRLLAAGLVTTGSLGIGRYRLIPLFAASRKPVTCPRAVRRHSSRI